MPVKDDSTNPAASKAALDLARSAERTSLKQTIPPVWFGIVISIIVGGLVAAVTAGTTELVAVALAALAGAISARRRNQPAYASDMPKGPTQIMALLGLIGIAFAIITGAKLLGETYAITWAPAISGTAMAVLVYGLSILERRRYISLIQRDDNA